jgi:L-amino acid N-acyltransferase YncA
MSTSIRSAKESDSDELARIYNHYIAHVVVTFQTEPAGETESAARECRRHLPVEALHLFSNIINE